MKKTKTASMITLISLIMLFASLAPAIETVPLPEKPASNRIIHYPYGSTPQFPDSSSNPVNELKVIN
jgi:hypothetical protein